MNDDDYRIALAGLLRCSEPPASRALGEFVKAVGPVDAWRAVSTRAAPPAVMSDAAPRLADRSAAALAAVAEADLECAARFGATIIGPDDPDWPAAGLEPLEWTRPFDACRTAWSPLALYRRGRPLPHTPIGAIAIVGSRAATPYGSRFATDFAADAAASGRSVISGAAFGIDVAAHRGALGSIYGSCLSSADDGATTTVAVLPSGIDRPYPAAHRDLIDAVARDGAVITEYPPGAVPARHRFLVRNRLIAALAEGTVVIEAGRRSGSLNTATTAANLGRQVFAVPGPVTSALSIGCHELIRGQRAELVTAWEDAAASLGPVRPAANPHRLGDKATDGVDLVAARVFDALPARGGIDVDAIAVEAAFPVGDVLGALTVLEMHDLAERCNGLWYRSARKPAAAAR